MSRSARAVRKKRGLAFDRENAGVRFAVDGDTGNTENTGNTIETEETDGAGKVRSSYTLENAVPSKDGYIVERVNENAGTEFNHASGVVCKENAVFSEADLPVSGKMAWIKQRFLEYAKENGIIGLHNTPCLGGDVEVTKGGIFNDLNHHGTPIRHNMIAVIPEMLKNAVLIQTESDGRSATHILAAKVRYGGERFVVGLVINESNGKFFYDHELTEIDALTGGTSEEPDAGTIKASVLNVTRNALLSSGFDAKNAKNIRFSVAPGNENLVVVHNLSAAKLRRAVKLGGLPVPSMAIVDAEKSDFTNFGEISLVADKNLIDPKRKDNKVFNADIYSARAPQTKKFYSDADYDRVEQFLKPYDADTPNGKSIGYIMDRYRDGVYDSDLEYKLQESDAVLTWYCRDHGIERPEASDWKKIFHIQGSSEFSQWWNDVALPKIGLEPEERMYAGNTRMGRPRWIPLTLENVVKAMTKKVRNGEGFMYGIGNIRSMKAVQFKSIAQIQSQRDHIVSTEEMKAVKEEIQNEFNELADRMRANSASNYGWEFNTGEDCLMAMAEGGRENAEYLHDRFGNNQELFREMAKFLDKLVNMPTEYFEAKPQRAVGLEEFKAAVIPEDTPADVRQALEEAGVMIYTYGERQDRKTALQMATRDNDLRFSMGEQDAETQRLVSMMQIVAGDDKTRPGEEYAKKFKAIYGVDIDPNEAKLIAVMAVDENRKEALRRYSKNALQFYRDSDPAFDFFLNFAGPEGKLNPGRDHLGEEFTGTWIPEDYKKYAIERKDHKTARGRKAYQIRRENALENAGGTPLDEVAKAYAEYAGIDPDEAAEKLLESLRHLNWKEIKSAYAKFRQESFAADREAARAAEEEFMQQEKFRIENEVFTEDEIKNRRDNAPELRMQTARPGNPSDLYRNILSQVLNVKSETSPNEWAGSYRFPFSAFLSTGRTCSNIR